MTLDLFSLNPYSPITNISKKEFLDSKSVILGHFTSSIFLKNILSKGLLAQSETKIESVGGHVKDTDKEYIYLTRIFDTFFSKKSVENHKGEEILIILDIPIKLLETDPFMGNSSSSKITEIIDIINNTTRNFRVHKKIKAEHILAIHLVNDLKNHNVLINHNYSPLPYSSINHKLKNLLNY